MEQVASIGFSAGTQVGEGFVQATELRRDARRDKENARASLLDGAIAETAIRRSERAAAGEAMVALGASGVAIGSGSALDLLFQDAKNREVAVMNAQYQAQTEARGYFQSANDKRNAAKAAEIGGVLRAGATILTGLSTKKNQDKVAAAEERKRRQQMNPGGMQLPLPARFYSGGLQSWGY